MKAAAQTYSTTVLFGATCIINKYMYHKKYVKKNTITGSDFFRL